MLTLAATVAGIMVAAGLLIKRDTEQSREQIRKWAQGYSPGFTDTVGAESPLEEGLLASSEEETLDGGGAGTGALAPAFTGPVVLSWTRIAFSVPAPGGGSARRRILRGVSGVAGVVPTDGNDELPGGGCLTAIIGPSGDRTVRLMSVRVYRLVCGIRRQVHYQPQACCKCSQAYHTGLS